MSSKALIGIPSYLPGDLAIHGKRLESHCKQLHAINEMYPDVDIVEVNQEYNKYDLEEIKKIGNNNIRSSYENLVFEKGLGVSGAKNKILEYFYQSDYDVLFLWDDDALVYPYYDPQYFISDLLRYRDIVGFQGLIRTWSPMQAPFKLENYKIRDEIHTHWILSPSLTVSASGGFILTNTKKDNGFELYMNEDMNPFNCTGYEDYDFFLRLVEHKIPSYVCSQFVCKLFLTHHSTIFSKNFSKDDSKEFRLKNHAKNLMYVYDRHREMGIKYSYLNGKLKSNITGLQHCGKCYIPREHPYEFTDKLIPPQLNKTDTLKRKSLF